MRIATQALPVLLPVLLAGLAASVVPVAPTAPPNPALPRRPLPPSGVWGVALGMHPRIARRAGGQFPPDFDEILALGARDVLVPVRRAVDGVTGSRVHRPRRHVSMRTVAELLRKARTAGLRVVPYPLIEVEGDRNPRAWRGRLMPDDPDRFWVTYRRFVTELAALAEQLKAPVFPIGVELTALTSRRHRERWGEVARAVRARYRGPLAFVANHDALDAYHLAPFPHVDVAGVSAYFPLAASPTTAPEDLAHRWRGFVRPALEAFGAQTGRPLLVFELGYPSRVGGTVRPWDDVGGAPVDLAEQAAAYEAATTVLPEVAGLRGVFFWNWFGGGGPFDRHFTPRGKPAESQLRRYLFSRRPR